jgi:hypothetical protein
MNKLSKEGDRKKTPKPATKKTSKRAKKLQLEQVEILGYDCALLIDAIISWLRRYRLLVKEAELTLSWCQKKGSNQQVLDALSGIKYHYENISKDMETSKSAYEAYLEIVIALTSTTVAGQQVSELPNMPQKELLIRSLQGGPTHEDFKRLLHGVKRQYAYLKYLALYLAEARENDHWDTGYLLMNAYAIEKTFYGAPKILFWEDFLRAKGKSDHIMTLPPINEW